ncbi:MAG: RIO1 family regulatory kinase/ATPase [Zestosphaera sp.]
MEEVFDRATVQAVLKLMRRGTISALKGVVSAGKESRVYWGTNSRGSDLAIKIYLTSSAEFRRGMIKYIVGDYRFDKNVPKSTRKLVTLWARKEFNNYVDLYRAGVSVPEPIDQHENVLVMELSRSV